MQQLDFAELDEDGRLVVVGDDGTRYAVPVDDRLRAALRPRPARSAEGGGQGPTASPREVQAMIRAGQTADEVAAATGWDPDRVRRFEGPVVAEREHVVGLAKAAHVRAQGRTDGSHTLDRRVRERLEARGVPAGDIAWDAARTESHGPWTVMVVFTAGGRERRAAWHYDVQDRSIEALDDEARWLSEDEQALPGGLEGHPLLGGSHSEDETADLMATMRERRQARGRRGRQGGRGQGAAAPAHEEEVLPLENLPDPAPGPGSDESVAVGTAEEPVEDLPPAAHPRGSAAESPAPVHPVDDTSAEARDDAGPHDAAEGDVAPGTDDQDAHGGRTGHRPTPSRRRGSGRQSRQRREQRRLRMPKLPPAVGEPPAEDVGAPEPEGTYARTVDPQEVSFDEFFGPEDDPLADVTDGGEDLDAAGPADPADVPDAEDGAQPDVLPDVEDLDPGQDEPVDPDEQIDLHEEDDLYDQDDTDEQIDLHEEDDLHDQDDTDQQADADQQDDADQQVDQDDPVGQVGGRVPTDDGPGDEPTRGTGTAQGAGSGTDGPAGGTDDPAGGTDDPAGGTEGAGGTEDPGDPADVPAEDAPEVPEPPRRKSRRTSVPSWDDIMFGGSDRRRR